MRGDKIGIAVGVGACFVRDHVRCEYGIDPWENAYLFVIAFVSGIIAAWIIVKRD
nr:MAG TPA: hypothetical protein [Caudoviricetes sp.]